MSDVREICTRIWGGLGNQMFQYAAGLALAKKHKTGLLLDPVKQGEAHTIFGLDIFRFEKRIWTPEGGAVRQSLFDRLRGKTKQRSNESRWSGPIYRQKHFCYADDFAAIAPGTYLFGYFQSETFFCEYADEIRKCYALDHVAPTIGQELIQTALGPDSVSVHIRRGDYLHKSKVTEVHGLLNADYYSRAYLLMRQLVPNARFLVFSDDAEAADELTRDWPDRTLVTGNSREQDLFLMAACSHHIIANSSFSWWGAWLGRNAQKQVIAPRRWFSRSEMQKVYVDDVCPVGWILI